MLNLLRQFDEDFPHVSNLALLSFCGYVIIWYLQIGYRIPFLGKIRFEFIYAALLSLYLIFFGGKIELDCPVFNTIILLFLAMIIQIPFSYNVQHSYEIFIDRVLKFSFMAIFIVGFIKSPKHLIFFLGAFLLACLKMGQEGFLGQITGNMVWENQGVMRLHGSTPIYEHPNSFTGMALGTMPFLIYLFPIASRVVKVAFIVQFIFALNIVLHTGSRTGYVAFFVMLLFIFYRSKGNKLKILIILSILGFLTIPFLEHQYIERFESIFTGKDKEGASTELRKEILSDSIKIFSDHPFGVGVGAFPIVRKKTFGRSQDTHNLYLEIATNIGIQGLIIFAYFIMQIFKCLSYVRREVALQLQKLSEFTDKIKESDRYLNEESLIGDHIRELKLLNAVAKALFLFLIIRLTLGLFGMDLYEIYWWFGSGLTIALFNINKYSSLKTEKLLLEI